MSIRLLNMASNGSEYFCVENVGSVAFILDGDWYLGNELMVFDGISGAGVGFGISGFLGHVVLRVLEILVSISCIMVPYIISYISALMDLSVLEVAPLPTPMLPYPPLLLLET